MKEQVLSSGNWWSMVPCSSWADDLFTKAMVETSIDKMDEIWSNCCRRGCRKRALLLGLMGFRVVVNFRGEVSISIYPVPLPRMRNEC
jgi:hypothetical protein